jgi:MFS family permease
MFSVAYSCSNIYMGNASKKWNKKTMLCAGVLGFSLTTLCAGLTNSIVVFAACRFLFGACASAINAPIYQLIANNFPPEYRSLANAIENSGYYIGGMLASFTVILIKNFGWRASYVAMGTFGATVGLLSLAIIKNPLPTPKKQVIDKPIADVEE